MFSDIFQASKSKNHNFQKRKTSVFIYSTNQIKINKKRIINKNKNKHTQSKTVTKHIYLHFLKKKSRKKGYITFNGSLLIPFLSVRNAKIGRPDTEKTQVADGAEVVPLNDLPKVCGSYHRYVVIGAGKTDPPPEKKDQ